MQFTRFLRNEAVTTGEMMCGAATKTAARVAGRDMVVIQGAGGRGLNAAAVAKEMGAANIIVIDQIPKLLGLHIHKGSFGHNLMEIFRGLPNSSASSFGPSTVSKI